MKYVKAQPVSWLPNFIKYVKGQPISWLPNFIKHVKSTTYFMIT